MYNENIKVKDYPGLYTRAQEIVRYMGINAEMPGRDMLIKAIVICKVQGSKHLYEAVASECSVIPSQRALTPKEEERHPVKQQILEAMRSVGIEDDVKLFVEELADRI